jgi:hypothetical protein
MIAVDNVEEHTNRVSEFGGKIHSGPSGSPVCVMSWCEDTEGNTFALHHRKDGTVRVDGLGMMVPPNGRGREIVKELTY